MGCGKGGFLGLWGLKEGRCGDGRREVMSSHILLFVLIFL